MHPQGLLVCTFVVVAAHAALIESMAGHGTRRPASGSAEQLPARLILLDREQVASLVPPRAEASAALEPKPAGKAHEAASAQDVDTDQGSSTGSSAGAHTLRPATSIYRPPEQLDVPPRPRSAPDISVLNGLAWSGTPIRLRLFIDGQGQVVDAQVLQSGEADEVIALVRQMFLATGFTAAIANGQPVPSYKDIEITVGTPP